MEQCAASTRKAKRAKLTDTDKCGSRSVQIFTKKQRAEEGYQSFRSIARLQRESGKSNAAPRIVKTLMDPGAELNLVRSSLLTAKSDKKKILIHAREPCEIILTNNGKEIGRVLEAVHLSFVLDNINGDTHVHNEWFYVWPFMDEEMILGAKYCREQEFTNFHTRLVPWDDSYSHDRSKRCVDNVVAIVPEKDETSVRESEDEQNRAAPERVRERVVTTCEKIDAFSAEHAKKPRVETQQTAGRRVADSSTFLMKGQDKGRAARHENHTPVNYNRQQSRNIANYLRYVIDDHTKLYKQLKQIKESDVNLTIDEQEALKDAARLCAKEAADIYEKQQHVLERKEISERRAKYFMNPEEEEEKSSSSRTFANGACVILQNLVTHCELNSKPARIVAYDETTSKYAISIASPRGYWWASEDKLASIDPAPTHDDFAACGIDRSTGQPTLDPLVKPVHRQYGKEVSAELTERCRALIEKYKHVFGKDISRPCKFKPMSITLVPNANLPSNPRYWKNSPAQRAEVREQLQSFLQMGVVRASSTAVVSNVLLVKRPGMPGKFRFTIDFRQLNEATVAAPWQMPDVDSQLSRLAGNQIFGCIDLSSYYHQIELEEGSKFLTGFVTEDGVFEYQRVPMGLKNACAHAQSQLQGAIDADHILSKYDLRNYFDDLPLAAKTEDDFLEQMEAVLKLGERFNLKFNLEKSVFGMDSITHVGFIVRADGIEVDPQRIESLSEVQVPKSIKGVQSVLGVWNYIRAFIPNFSTRALPITNLVGKGAGKAKHKTFLWTTECQAAFDDLKAATLDTKLLANIDYTLPIFIRCDSSQFGAGAVLFQFNEQGQERPISYASRKYTLAERNYCTFQQEAAAVVWSLEKFSNFHQGHHVTVQSDHKNLSWIKKSAMPQLTRWRLRLQDFDFSLEYFEGVKNVVADGLSRMMVDDKDIDISIRDFLPDHAAQQSFLQGSVPVRCLNQYSAVNVRDKQLTAAEKVWEGQSPEQAEHEEPETVWTKPVTPDEVDEINSEKDSDLERRQFAPVQAAEAELPMIPDLGDESPRQIFDKVHNAEVGHNGVLVTLNRVLRINKEWASRKEMLQNIDQFISGCPVCQKFRKRHDRRADERFVIEGNPFSELSVDILKLPKRDCNNNLYVVVIVDSFSRWVCLEAIPTKSALDAARAILRTFGTFGVPLTIRSDGGKEFINDILASIELILGVKHHKIMAYHHEGNSLAEKANRSVLENLRNLIFDKRYILNGEHQWSDLLPMVQRIMNASFNSSIGCSPAALVFGDNIELDRCLITPQPAPLVVADADGYVQALAHNQRVLLDVAAETLHRVHSKNVQKFNRTHKRDSKVREQLQSVAADEEQLAWVLARVKDDAPLEKWKPRWAGPYRLLDFKENSTSVVRLYDTVAKKVIEAHINDVEMWDSCFVNSEEGLSRIAETDGWSYPMDGILGMALVPESEDDEPSALPLDQPRLNSNKHKYLFSVKWRGYAEPSWEPFKTVMHTSVFDLFAMAHPVLKLKA